MNTAQMPADTQNGTPDFVLADNAIPVAMTIPVAAASPHLIRLMFPSFASWSWKKGEDTVNHDGQKPAKTPLASPMSRGMSTSSSVLILFPPVSVLALQFSRRFPQSGFHPLHAKWLPPHAKWLRCRGWFGEVLRRGGVRRTCRVRCACVG